MKTASLFSLIITLNVSVWSSLPQIHGQILDRDLKPVSGVQLTLQKKALLATTDSLGYFDFTVSQVFPIKKFSSPYYSLQIQGKKIIIESSQQNQLKATLVDIRGCRIPLKTTVSSPGRFSAMLDNSQLASGISVLQIESANTREIVSFKIVNGFSHALNLTHQSNLKSHSVTLTQDCNDTLTCIKAGYLRKKIPVNVCSVDSPFRLHIYPEKLDITSANYPVLDGSTSTQPVGVTLAATLLGTSYGYETAMDGSKKLVAFSSSNPELADSINTIIVKHTATHSAYVNVIDGTAKIGMIARQPSTEELAHAESLGVSLEIRSFAIDAFIFLLNIKNPIDNFSVDNIRSIYSGTITNWEQLGSHNLAIKPYQREKSSGSQELMISMVMKELPIINAPNMIVMTMMGPFNALQSDTAGIGYTVYFYGKNMAPEHVVKFCSVDGIFPDYDNIASHKYPLWADVFLVRRTDLDPSGNASHIWDYLLSPAGQTIIKKCGYVPADPIGVE